MWFFQRNNSSLEPKQAFARRFGWRYGLTLGLALVAAGWGLDAWRLADASAELPWVKVLVASITLIPLGMIVGALAGRVHPSVSSTVLFWAGYGILGGLIAGHLQFDALRITVALKNPAMAELPLFPYTSEGEFLTGVAIFFGIAASFPAALFQVISTDWAWDRSADDGQMTWGTRAMLGGALVLGLGLGLFDDAMVNQLTAPFLLTNRVMQVALQTPTDLDTNKMTDSQMFVYMAGLPWRDKISERYTLFLVDYDPDTFQNTTMDIAFDNGVILRCHVIQARIMSGCFDASAEFGELIRQFVKTGATPCPDCSVRVQTAATAWQLQHHSELGEPTGILAVHHSGGAISVRAQYGASTQVECYLVENEPVVIRFNVA